MRSFVRTCTNLVYCSQPIYLHFSQCSSTLFILLIWLHGKVQYSCTVHTFKYLSDCGVGFLSYFLLSLALTYFPLIILILKNLYWFHQSFLYPVFRMGFLLKVLTPYLTYIQTNTLHPVLEYNKWILLAYN